MRRLLALFLATSLVPAAQAAESYDNCVGFIDALPATISTQGVWCLRKDLSTANTSGAAITIASNNITIDCNGFKLGGLAAGPASLATGVLAEGRLNATVRNCALRGFHHGVALVGPGGGGHLVEDNRIDQSINAGIFMFGHGNLVQRNRIFDTGSQHGYGILAEADIIDNTITGVIGEWPTGILAFGRGAEVRGNRIREMVAAQETLAKGIEAADEQQSIVDNRVIGGPGQTPGTGILASGEGASFCRDNLIASFATGIETCEDNGGNVVHP